MIMPLPKNSSGWGFAILSLGIILIGVGILLGGTWADVSIEVGAAAGVGGIVLLFKPRLIRQVDQVATEVASTTAEAIATSKTEELEKRLEQFESISEVQARVLERLDEETEQMIVAMAAPDFSDLDSLLSTATDRGFFSGRLFVKTSRKRGKPLIEIFYDRMELEPFSNDSPRINLRIQTLRKLEDSGHEFLGEPDGAFTLEPKDTLNDITEKVVFAYNRVGIPLDQDTLAILFEHLASSFRMMAAGRQNLAEGKSGIQGRLFFMINEEWVLTDKGLVSPLSTRIFGPRYDEYGQSFAIRISESPCPPECNAELWDEAQFYVLRLNEEISNRF